MEKLTPEQQEDINTRVEAFRKDYSSLVEKYQVDFITYPQFARHEQGFFGVISQMMVVDKKYAPVPSPFQEDGKIIKE